MVWCAVPKQKVFLIQPITKSVTKSKSKGCSLMNYKVGKPSILYRPRIEK